MKILFTFCTKQGNLIRRSIVLSLPPQLVFPAERSKIYLLREKERERERERGNSEKIVKKTMNGEVERERKENNRNV